MRTVTKRELSQNAEAVLDAVTEVDDIVVTELGMARWRVSSMREADTRLARLEREGRYTPPATAPTPWPSRPGGRAYTSGEADALLDAVRGGR